LNKVSPSITCLPSPPTQFICCCTPLQAKQQQLIQEKRKQAEERLLAALAQPMGFHKGKPLAALVVFRACLQWRAFQADRTSVFDRIIQVRGPGV
jgi:myosin-5